MGSTSEGCTITAQLTVLSAFTSRLRELALNLFAQRIRIADCQSILLDPSYRHVDIRLVRNLKSFIAVGVMVAATPAFGTLPGSQTSPAQPAEVKEQQETVNLTISGMT